jgi:hypothetical protein
MLDLKARTTSGAEANEYQSGSWRLSIPAGNCGAYRLAQLDDYLPRSRSKFLWQPPLYLSLSARVSAQAVPGTWGFGLWNDPFSANLGLGGMARRLPTLPDTAWFFFAAPPNYLALYDDHPAQGMLAATFSSIHLSPWLMALGAPLLPLLAVPRIAGWMRRAARHLIKESARQLELDLTAWHNYRMEWLAGQVVFLVDGATVFITPVSPQSPLGLVFWIDNQYAAFPPGGKFKYGSLANSESAWLEISNPMLTK